MTTHPRATQAVVSAMFLLLGAATDANAQRAALVQNLDEPARAPYQEQTSCSGNGSNVCGMTFRTVPAGKRREIRVVSCSAQIQSASAALIFQSVALYATLPSRVGMEIPFQSALPGTPYNGAAYAQTSMFFEPGDAPSIQVLVLGQTLSGASCTVTGRDIVLP